VDTLDELADKCGVNIDLMHAVIAAKEAGKSTHDIAPDRGEKVQTKRVGDAVATLPIEEVKVRDTQNGLKQLPDNALYTAAQQEKAHKEAVRARERAEMHARVEKAVEEAAPIRAILVDLAKGLISGAIDRETAAEVRALVELWREFQ
jgi:hypothetical protein